MPQRPFSTNSNIICDTKRACVTVRWPEAFVCDYSCHMRPLRDLSIAHDVRHGLTDHCALKGTMLNQAHNSRMRPYSVVTRNRRLVVWVVYM
jgi:hypothetical protein